MNRLKKYIIGAVVGSAVVGAVFFPSEVYISFLLAWLTVLPAALVYATYRLHRERARSA